MWKTVVLAVLLCSSEGAHSQAVQQPKATPRPTLEEVRKAMGISSVGDVRGQQDAVGFASKAEQMAKVWELSAALPEPETFGFKPGSGVVGAICPHDDYVFAGRVYRRVLPLVTAKTVVFVGVFHKYRKFGVKDALVFDPYRVWRSPDGDIKVSDLRQELLATLPAGDFLQDAAMHDSEHSLEALAYWLKHARPDVEILPIIIPSMPFERMHQLSLRLGTVLANAAKRRGWSLGKDFAIVVSSDGVHYGNDFKYTPHGAGGVEVYIKACDQERAILRGPLAGALTPEKLQNFFATCVNPENPDEYRHTWCGRFSIPFGLMLLSDTSKALGIPTPVGMPIAFGTSIGSPEIPVRELGMGATAQANLYHFVGYPGVVYRVDSK